MGVAIYIIAEKEGLDVDIEVDGKAVGRFIERLDELSGKLGVKAISEFLSADPVELVDMFDGSEVDYPAEEWFSAEEGLVSIKALLEVELEGAEWLLSEEVRVDLEQYQQVLRELKDGDVRWHFCVDI